MKNFLNNLKKPNTILAVLAIVLFVAQIAVMFIPCFTLTPAPNRREPNPVPQDYSLMDYCWFECEDITKILDKQIKNYVVNDYTIDLVLVNFFGLVAVVFLLWELLQVFRNFNTPGAQAVKLFSNAFCLIWAAQTLYAFLTAGILAYCNDDTVWLYSVCIGAVLAVCVAIRAVIAFFNRTRYVVAK